MGVQLYLVDIGHDAGLVQHPLQMGWLEIGCADGAEGAGVEQLAESPNRIDVVVLVRIRPMHEQQVEVVQPESIETCLVGAPYSRDAVPMAVELAGDEQLSPIDA